MLSDKNNEMWKRVQYDNINKRNVLFTRKSAFTLAEVLITLGVIGVVAAMTIPTLIHNYKAKEMRKGYYEQILLYKTELVEWLQMRLILVIS